MVRGIAINPETGDSECSTCGYEFQDFEDAQRHFEEECEPHDDIKPHDFKAEITISAPAKNYDKAAQNIRNWEDEVQEAIGGLTFEINSLKRKGWPE